MLFRRVDGVLVVSLPSRRVARALVVLYGGQAVALAVRRASCSKRPGALPYGRVVLARARGLISAALYRFIRRRGQVDLAACNILASSASDLVCEAVAAQLLGCTLSRRPPGIPRGPYCVSVRTDSSPRAPCSQRACTGLKLQRAPRARRTAKALRNTTGAKRPRCEIPSQRAAEAVRARRARSKVETPPPWAARRS